MVMVITMVMLMKMAMGERLVLRGGLLQDRKGKKILVGCQMVDSDWWEEKNSIRRKKIIFLLKIRVLGG